MSFPTTIGFGCMKIGDESTVVDRIVKSLDLTFAARLLTLLQRWRMHRRNVKADTAT
jgi:hypothetical protein